MLMHLLHSVDMLLHFTLHKNTSVTSFVVM